MSIVKFYRGDPKNAPKTTMPAHLGANVILTCQGIPTPDSMVPAGTDVEAVRQGYISIGKVRAF